MDNPHPNLKGKFVFVAEDELIIAADYISN